MTSAPADRLDPASVDHWVGQAFIFISADSQQQPVSPHGLRNGISITPNKDGSAFGGWFPWRMVLRKVAASLLGREGQQLPIPGRRETKITMWVV